MAKLERVKAREAEKHFADTIRKTSLSSTVRTLKAENIISRERKVIPPTPYKELKGLDIEEGVKELVRIMNKLPFVETTESCEGHLEVSKTDPKSFHFLSGFITFKVDGELDGYTTEIKSIKSDAKKFIDALEAFSKRFSSVNFGLDGIYDGSDPRPEFMFEFTSEKDYYNESQGKAMLAENRRVLDELAKFCKRYIESRL